MSYIQIAKIFDENLEIQYLKTIEMLFEVFNMSIMIFEVIYEYIFGVFCFFCYNIFKIMNHLEFSMNVPFFELLLNYRGCFSI